jgi:hypothetical protein
VVGELIDVFGKNIRRAEIEIAARFEINAGLRGIEEVFPAREEIVPGISAKILRDDAGAGRLRGGGQGEE